MEQRAVIYTKFGLFELKGSEKGISSVHRLDYEAPITEDLPKVLRKCAQQLNAYFAGKRTTFDIKLDWSGTSEFNKKSLACFIGGALWTYHFIWKYCQID